MAKIIPAILVHSKEELADRLEKIKGLADFIQIDVMDGKFVPNTTLAAPKEISGLIGDYQFEVHLMIEDAPAAIEDWQKAGAKRLIFHYEALKLKEIPAILKKVKKLEMEAGLAINPETPVSKIEKYFDDLDLVLVMGVNPGFSGQAFQKIALEKIKEVKDKGFKGLVEVDGGVSEENIKDIAQAGADLIAAASAIFGKEGGNSKGEVKNNFEKLK